ncbi:type IV pilus twitching motility protein PilT (plasmid) [Agrobacterium rosae]|nr:MULTISPECIES: ATPase, T2SS/T4P/T4SS family [Agrobacterium]MCF1501555.1 secretion system protein E [Allorhizobium sp. Av2]MDX8311473.1 ATPase, T2SS/T4P/T4SS family [Agrobacterium sp. rho-13.3]MDX8316294.1 ATPase, T2SS/T4P/T4SS family [Agrobacterium rosae]MDX8321727.1 ATPase, T2SS/T4P/T4SS family [Agrobacterium sp. rho-8.1]
MLKLHERYGTWLGGVENSGIRLDQKEDLRALLTTAVRNTVSDIFIQTGKPVMVSLHGKMIGITNPVKKSVMENVMRWITNQDSVVARLQSGNDFDSAFSIDDTERVDDDGYPIKHRFRLNLTANYFDGDLGYQASLRYIPSNPPTFETVGLEKEIIPHLDSGMGSVIFAGETGSGKTSTIAAAIMDVLAGNTTMKGNILTYEAPIEYTFDHVPSATCIISQTEIGLHLPSFAAGVRNSLRRKPGLILIGELRDAETISASVEAANNGHPIYTTTHANSTDLTFKRLFEKFPSEYQSQAFFSILATTNMIVAQRLVPRKDHPERYVCLREWIVIDNDIRRVLEEAGPSKYDRVMRKLLDSGELGDKGRSIKKTVEMRWREGIISDETALWVLRNFGYHRVKIEDLH